MKKTVKFFTLGFFAVMVIGVCATPRGGEKTNPTQAKLDAWRRKVKKMQTAPVADGFVKWTGFDTIKTALNARWLAPSDLRGRFVVVIELDDAKVVEQFTQTASLQDLGFSTPWDIDWEFASVSRDIVVLYNVHDLSEDGLKSKIIKNKDVKVPDDCNFYGNVTFDGAPDSATERPYVYVMPPEGADPIYKGKFVAAKTKSEVKKAIKKAAEALPTWRPWYGYVSEVKHAKGFEAAAVCLNDDAMHKPVWDKPVVFTYVVKMK